jgi:hypothetical protein
VDPVHQSLTAPDAEIGDFFARPVQIYSFSWAVGQAPYLSIDPWSLFFENPRVMNRINNYSLLQANLNVKITINGNGFHSGRMLAFISHYILWTEPSSRGPEKPAIWLLRHKGCICG